MVYKKYIKRGDKIHGPYYYESYRDEEGNVRKKYLGSGLKKSINWRWIILFVGVFLALIFFGFYGSKLIGYSIFDGENVSANATTGNYNDTRAPKNISGGSTITGNIVSLEDVVEGIKNFFGGGGDGGGDGGAAPIQFGPTDDQLTPIARWDVVPRQRINAEETLNVGVVAFSKWGIKNVTFVVSGPGYAGTKTATAMTLNSQTGVWEYWVQIYANDFSSDGQITIDATVYGNDGGVRTSAMGEGLEQLILYSNRLGSLPYHETWVAASGGNDGNCAVDNPALPCATIGRAMSIIANANGGNADGGVVRLKSGHHTMQNAGFWGGIATQNEWVTITNDPASGGTRENTFIDASTVGGDYISSEFLKVKSLTLHTQTNSRPFFQTGGSDSKTIWIDDCNVLGTDRYDLLPHPIGNNYRYKYFTNSYLYNLRNALGEGEDGYTAEFARNLTIEHIGHDAMSATPMIVNVILRDQDPGAFNQYYNWHSDVWQSNGVTTAGEPPTNWIAYNVHATDLHYQGVFWRDKALGKNNAIVNVFVELRDPVRCQSGDSFCGGTSWLGGLYDHLLIWQSTFIGTNFEQEFWFANDAYTGTPLFRFSNSSFVGNVFTNWKTTEGVGWTQTSDVEFRDNHYIVPTGVLTYTPGIRNTTGIPQIETNIASPNFGKPLAGSPLLDRVSTPVVPVDIYGNLRGSSADVGAIELNVQAACNTDPECDDGLWCTGTETCSAGNCVHQYPSGNGGCSDDGFSCTTTCNEVTDSCNTPVNSVCDTIPNDCVTGTCVGVGGDANGCSFANTPIGTACSDSLSCSAGNTCDGNGVCGILTDSLCTDNPLCGIRQCTAGGCVYGDCPCQNATVLSSWYNSPFATKTGTFTVGFDVTPISTNIDFVVGLSNTTLSDPVADYSKLATAIRFDSLGIDVRNGGAYVENLMTYTPGTSYHFRFVVNVSSHTYDVYITPQGGTETALGTNFAFRTEQASVSNLNNFAFIEKITAESQVCNFGLINSEICGNGICETGETNETCSLDCENAFYGMEIESVVTVPNGVIVNTTGATYVLNRTAIEMWRRIDPATNDYNPRKVAVISFDRDMGSFVSLDIKKKYFFVSNTYANFTFYSDSFFVITARQPFNYTHTNLIANATWNEHFYIGTYYTIPEAIEDYGDRMWTDGYGGSLHAKIANSPKVILNSTDLTQLSMSPSDAMGHMVYPPKKFDFENLYGSNARPFVYSYSPVDDPDSLLGNLSQKGFGVILLWNSFYRPSCANIDGVAVHFSNEQYFPYVLNMSSPCNETDPVPTWLPFSDAVGYEFRNITQIKSFVSKAHAKGFKVISYMAASEFHPELSRGGFQAHNQSIENTERFMRAFQNEYDLDGWYFDNGGIYSGLFYPGTNRSILENYKFMKQVREDIGDDGIILHHDSVDVWGYWSGLKAVMVDTYATYSLTGETGMPYPQEPAESDDPNDPYLRFYSSGYGMSQAYGSNLLNTYRMLAISEEEKNRVMGENLHSTEWLYGSDEIWNASFKPAYDIARTKYLSNPDVDWPLNESSWFRAPTNVQLNWITGTPGTSVRISWRTADNSDSELAYTSNGVWWESIFDVPLGPDRLIDNESMVKQHNIVLRNLKENTNYEFRIRSRNRAAEFWNQTTWGYVGNFTTGLGNQDSDIDGMADEWESIYFGNLNNNPAADPDGDGFSNLAEYQNGIDPLFFDNSALCNYDGICFGQENSFSCLNDCPDSSLIAFWSFDDGTGRNKVGSEHRAFVQGAEFLARGGYNGKGAFDLETDTHFQDDYILLNSTIPRAGYAPEVGLYNNFTITAWIKRSGTGRWEFFTGGLTGGVSYTGLTDYNRIIMSYSDSAKQQRTCFGSIITNTDWHNLAFVAKNNENISIYLDGLDVTSNCQQPKDNGGFYNASVLVEWLGKFYNYGFMKGGIDDVSVWKKALNNSEVCGAAGKSWNGTSCNVLAPPAFCDLTSGSWDSTEVVNGTQVTLTVAGNNCGGQNINFTIYEDDPVFDDTVISMDNVVFPSATWTAVWTYPGDDDFGNNPRTYYFAAKVSNNASESVTSGILNVNNSEAVQVGCGNGFLEDAEECDDGNLIVGDGCSSLCIIETCGDGQINLGETNIVFGDDNPLYTPPIRNLTEFQSALNNIYNLWNGTGNKFQISLILHDNELIITNPLNSGFNQSVNTTLANFLSKINEPDHDLLFYEQHTTAQESYVLSNSLLDVALLDVTWNETEPQKGVFDFVSLDGNISQWAAANKKVMLKVVPYGKTKDDKFTPNWIYTNVPKITWDDDGNVSTNNNITLPVVWNDNFFVAYEEYVNALADKYNNDPNVDSIRIGIGHLGFTTASLDPQARQPFLNAGWTMPIWEEYVKRTINLYENKFPNKKLYLVITPGYLRNQNDLSSRKNISEYAASRGINLIFKGADPNLATFESYGFPPIYLNMTLVDYGEECDDGNLIDGDGCDSNCMIEFAVCDNDGVCEAGEDEFNCPADCGAVYGMAIESVVGNSSQVVVNTTGASYVLSRTGMEMWRRIDPATNDYNPRLVARLDFITDIGPFGILSNDGRTAVVDGNLANFTFYSDSLFILTAKFPFTYNHTNLIANATWNKGFGSDRMWTDGYGGSMHADYFGFSSATSLGNDTTRFSLNSGSGISHMVFPPRKFDFEGLYGTEARPFVYFINPPSILPTVINNMDQLAQDGFGVFFLWNRFYRPACNSTGDHYTEEQYWPYQLDPPPICNDATPAWIPRPGTFGYEFEDPIAVKNFVDIAHAKNFSVVSYMAAYAFDPDHSPSGWEQIDHQPINDTLEFMKAFQNEYDLDGWYFDNADINPGNLKDSYEFMKSVRKDVGDNGTIFHHNSVDLLGYYSGVRAIMVDTYSTYIYGGETGSVYPYVTAQIDEPNDPYLRFYSSGYGLTQAYGSHKRRSDMNLSISEEEKNRAMVQNLNGVEWTNPYIMPQWYNSVKPAYDLRRAEYLSGSFDPDVDWPVNNITGWFRAPTNIQLNWINSTSVNVTWETNSLGDSNVSYSNNSIWWVPELPPSWNRPKGPAGSAGDSILVTLHSVVLENLNETYDYEFRIRSSNRQSGTDEIIWGYTGDLVRGSVGCGNGICEAGENSANCLADCPTVCTDADIDGYNVTGGACGEIDCNDNVFEINPGATEMCNGIDDDCDLQTDEEWPELGTQCQNGLGECQTSGIFVCNAFQTNITCSAIAGAPSSEQCDSLDNDCDGQTDEQSSGIPLNQSCYTGLPGTQNIGLCVGGTQICSSGTYGSCVGEVTPQIDICIGDLDENCNGVPNEGCVCTAGNTQPCGSDVGECAFGTQTCQSDGTWGSECVGIKLPEDEICDGLDNNCDGNIDEDVLITYYLDSDGDTYGDLTQSVEECQQPIGYVSNNLDCNDLNSSAHPGANEICDGLDNDCDTLTDEGGSLCSDGVACTEDVCNSGTCEYSDNNDLIFGNAYCNQNDGNQFCNGYEYCSQAAYLGGISDAFGCVAGTLPVIDDGIACTIDSCDEANNASMNLPDNDFCISPLECIDFTQIGTGCALPGVCGNSDVEIGEQCDLLNLSNEDCTSQGYPAGGILGCDLSCSFDYSGCSLLPLYSKFNGNTTDFDSEAEICNVTDAVLENINYGMINFTNETICFERMNLDEYVFIEDKLLGVNVLGERMGLLDVPALLRFYNISFGQPKILIDGEICPESVCNVTDYNTTTKILKVKVTGFSNYTVVEDLYCGDGTCNNEESCGSCSQDCSCQQTNGNDGNGDKSGGSSPRYQCNDRKDNDLDGAIDYPNDLGCNSSTDNSELFFATTTASGCIESWTCGDYGECVNGTQTRICRDENECGTQNGLPETNLECWTEGEFSLIHGEIRWDIVLATVISFIGLIGVVSGVIVAILRRQRMMRKRQELLANALKFQS